MQVTWYPRVSNTLKRISLLGLNEGGEKHTCMNHKPQNMHEIVVLVILFMAIKGTTNISSIPTDL